MCVKQAGTVLVGASHLAMNFMKYINPQCSGSTVRPGRVWRGEVTNVSTRRLVGPGLLARFYAVTRRIQKENYNTIDQGTL